MSDEAALREDEKKNFSEKSRSFIDMLLNNIYAYPEIEKLIDSYK